MSDEIETPDMGEAGYILGRILAAVNREDDPNLYIEQALYHLLEAPDQLCVRVTYRGTTSFLTVVTKSLMEVEE